MQTEFNPKLGSSSSSFFLIYSRGIRELARQKYTGWIISQHNLGPLLRRIRSRFGNQNIATIAQTLIQERATLVKFFTSLSNTNMLA